MKGNLFAIAACVWSFSSLAGHSQVMSTESSTHGTINVLIGSKLGAVAETDTRLSDVSENSLGLGQKLFQIDNRTICMIADFYSSPGPRITGYPFATSMPDILEKYVNSAPPMFKASFAEKVDLITQALAFDLQVISILQDIAGDNSRLPSSRLTVVGYDGDVLKVQQVEVSSSGKGGNGTASVVKDPEVSLSEKISYFTAGRDDVAQRMLQDEESPLNAGSPTMKYFHSLKNSVNSVPLNLEEIKRVEDKLEYETFRAYPKVVGGEKEVAFLEAGKVIKFEAPIVSAPIRHISPITLSWGNIQNGGGTTVYLGQGEVYINVRSTIQNAVVHLDRSVYTQSTFLNTTFIYEGVGPAIFDNTNFLSNCKLMLGPKVTHDDPFVQYIARHYPGVTVTK